MTFSKKINAVRRFLTRGLTKNIGRKKNHPKIKEGEQFDVKRILISRPNGRLGNLLMITPLVQEIENTFPDCKIDLFVKGTLAPILFKNYKSINHIIHLPKKPFKELVKYMKVWTKIKAQRYDLAINIGKNSSSGRISTKISNAQFKIFGDENEDASNRSEDSQHMAKAPVYNFRRFLSEVGFAVSNSKVLPLNLKLDSQELLNGQEIVKSFFENDKKTISIFTYATCEKCYSQLWWKKFYEQLKTEFAEYNFLEILPMENVSQIDFQATSFYSKDVREIGAVIANTCLFIGADSGIMHLASSVKTPTFGLFSVTNPVIYAPYNPKSVAIDTNSFPTEAYMEVLRSMLDC